MSNLDHNTRLAILIDADNAQPAIAGAMFNEIAKFGISSVRRIYGDWTSSHMNGWKPLLLENSIQPVQQFSYTTGKNATDSAMIIDAMDLLYTERFDGFCLVSSDSDFTRLAMRIREQGLMVYGFGEKKTPRPFVSACNRFIFTEVLRDSDKSDDSSPETAANLKQDTKLIHLLREAIEVNADDGEWASLAPVGSTIIKLSPEFDSRNYGFAKLSELFKAIDLFDVKKRVLSSDGKSFTLVVRNKRKQ